jgi:hypothetical protein
VPDEGVLALKFQYESSVWALADEAAAPATRAKANMRIFIVSNS